MENDVEQRLKAFMEERPDTLDGCRFTVAEGEAMENGAFWAEIERQDGTAFCRVENSGRGGCHLYRPRIDHLHPQDVKNILQEEWDRLGGDPSGAERHDRLVNMLMEREGL